MRTHPIVEYYQALRDSAPCLSRAATLPKGTKLGLGKRRAPGNTIILSQPYRRHVSTDRLNREGSQLAASLEGEPGPTPAGKTLPHSFPETSRFRRERARDVAVQIINVIRRYKQRPRRVLLQRAIESLDWVVQWFGASNLHTRWAFYFHFLVFQWEKSRLTGSNSRPNVSEVTCYLWATGATGLWVLLFKEKSERAARPSEHPPVRGKKMSKRWGGITGCKYKTPIYTVVALGQQIVGDYSRVLPWWRRLVNLRNSLRPQAGLILMGYDWLLFDDKLVG